MKRTDLIRKLESSGCILIRHGEKHDWYHNPSTKKSQPIPRHREINETLARHIIKFLMNDSAAEQRSIFGNYFLFAAERRGTNPKRD